MQKNLLFIPGPVAVSEPVLAAMAKPLINHRGPEYARLLHSIAERMQSIFATTGDVLLMGASGTGSLEAAVTNMFGPGDTVLACPTGVFGERIAAIAKIWGMGRRSRPTSTICAAACRPRKEDHRYSVDTQRNVYGCANRPGRNVARYWGSSRVRRRRFGKRLGRERIQDG